MTLEVIVIAIVRIAGSLPVLRWPLIGGLLAIAIDASDLLLMGVLDLGGVPDYQSLDKWLDQVYLALFLVVALRWTNPARSISIALYLYRLVGFVLFELTGERALLLLFPNVFEFWFIFVAAVGHERIGRWSHAQIGVSLVVLTLLKEIQEWALHGARLFDSISALDAIDLVWRRLTGQ